MIVRSLLMMAVTLTIAAGAALADPKDDVLQAMVKCANTSGKKARLQCFDEISPALRALYPSGTEAKAAPTSLAPAVTPAAPSAAVATVQPTEERQESWFGLHFGGHRTPQTAPAQFGSDLIPSKNTATQTPPPPKELDQIAAVLTDYATNPLGQLVLFLDNGQVWKQVENDYTKVHLKPHVADNKVEISRGTLGSYWMKVNAQNATIKVVRIK